MVPVGPSADPRHPRRAATPIGDLAEGLATNDFCSWRMLVFDEVKTSCDQSQSLEGLPAPSRVAARRKVWFLGDTRIFHASSGFI